MVFNDYTKQRILFYSQKGRRPPAISRLLAKEGIQAGRWGILNFIKQYRSTATISQKPGSGGCTKITEEMKRVVENKMREDDKTTAMQLHQLLKKHGYNVSK